MKARKLGTLEVSELGLGRDNAFKLFKLDVKVKDSGEAESL
jgi:hypothetical protein